MNSFNNNWKIAETTFATYFNGTVVEDLEQQYKDIDISLNKSNLTVSIKDIGDSSRKYGGAMFETTLLSSQTGKQSDGSFYKCAADYYAIRLWHKGRMCWYVTKTADLKHYLESTPCKEIRTRAETERKNRQRGRFYDGTICKMVRVEDLVANTECLCIPIQALKNKEQRATNYLIEWGFI